MVSKSFKELPEGSKHFFGLVTLTITIFLLFFLLNAFFYDEIIPETLIVEEEEQINPYDELLNSIFKKKLNVYKSADGYLLNAYEYKILCTNTKIVTQRAVMGANIINFKAQVIYNANGNLIEETFVKWDDEANHCLAGYVLKGNFNNEEVTIEVSGQAQSFLNTGVDTRVYFIRNF
ncbi:hypothetical protein OAJ95_01420 [Pelagibacteraceae bacterium]|nr:hypothetical protein [Pelagibacteraceae bacterium]